MSRRGARFGLWNRRLRGFGQVLLALAGFPGCYAPERLDCVVRCDKAGRCPWDMSCSDGSCASAGRVCGGETSSAPDEPPERQPVCAPSARRCASMTEPQRCEEDRTWHATRECSGDAPVCVMGECRVCAPGVSRCLDQQRSQVCGDDGWLEPETCSGERPVCGPSKCTPALQVSVGSAHACALDREGAIRCWGDGSRAALGLGDSQNRGDGALPPGRVKLGRALSVAAGGSHTCAVLEDRSLRCWGDNSAGQLGLGDTEIRGDTPGEVELLRPIELGEGEEILEVAPGSRHTCALLGRGAVKCWGDNGSGQLGLGDTRARGDEPGEMGRQLSEVELDEPAVSIGAGALASCAVLKSGAVRCWGQDYVSANSVGDRPGEVSEFPSLLGEGGFSRVWVGSVHACALGEAAGLVSCWGASRGGQLGTLDPSNTPRRVRFGEPGNVSSVSVGAAHSCALVNGEVVCWGVNLYGSLGLGTDENARGDTRPPEGQRTEVEQTSFLSLDPTARVVGVSAGEHFTCVALADARVKCWGLNHRGQLGQKGTRSRGGEGDPVDPSLESVAFDD